MIDHSQLHPEVQEGLDNLREMTTDDIRDYFTRLAEAHIESGTYATAADYIYAAEHLAEEEVVDAEVVE